MTGSVLIEDALITMLRKEADASPAIEVCGLLFGTSTRIEGACGARNVADRPETAFEIDPRVLLAAHRQSRVGRPRIIGCYHSHPNGPARPSARDAAAAEPGHLWLILARMETRLWQFDGPGFREMRMVAS